MTETFCRIFQTCLAFKEATTTRQKLPAQCFGHASHPSKQPRHDRNFRRNVSVTPRIQASNHDTTETSGAMFRSRLASKQATTTRQKLPAQCFGHASHPSKQPRHDRNFRRNVSVTPRIQASNHDTTETSGAMFRSRLASKQATTTRQKLPAQCFGHASHPSKQPRHDRNFRRNVSVTPRIQASNHDTTETSGAMFRSRLASKQATTTRQKLPAQCFGHASHPSKQPRHDRNFRRNVSVTPRIQASNHDTTETSGAMFRSRLASKQATTTRQKLPAQCFGHASHPSKQPRHDRNFRRNVSVMPRIQASNHDTTETSGAMFRSCLASKQATTTRQKLPAQCFGHASHPSKQPRHDRNFRRNVSVMP